jgi:hypothetical protein
MMYLGEMNALPKCGCTSHLPFVILTFMDDDFNKESIKIRSGQHEHTSQCDGPAWLKSERGAVNAWFPFIDGVSLVKVIHSGRMDDDFSIDRRVKSRCNQHK